MTALVPSRRSYMITLTDTAATKVAQLLADEGASDLALRVAVKSGEKIDG